MAVDATTHLYLVRHGEAVCNVERTIEGVATCRGLAPTGHEQADRLAARLRHEGFVADALYSSPIARAQQTAAPIAAALGVPIRLDADLEEVRPGEAEGMTWDQFASFYGSTEGWEPTVPFAPGAEAWNDFARRTSRALDRIAGAHDGGKVVIVAHGGVVDASFFHFFMMDPERKSPIDFHTDNTSLTEWQLRVFEGDLRRWRLARYNDTAHNRVVG